VNIVQYCVHMYISGKMIPVEISTGIEGRRDKGKWWRV
jgi:hypothetical protein